MIGRITTRRARACVPESIMPGDIEIAQTDQDELQAADLTGRGFARAIVVCTMVDISDPRFRLWLLVTLIPRLFLPISLQLEIVGA